MLFDRRSGKAEGENRQGRGGHGVARALRGRPWSGHWSSPASHSSARVSNDRPETAVIATWLVGGELCRAPAGKTDASCEGRPKNRKTTGPERPEAMAVVPERPRLIRPPAGTPAQAGRMPARS